MDFQVPAHNPSETPLGNTPLISNFSIRKSKNQRVTYFKAPVKGNDVEQFCSPLAVVVIAQHAASLQPAAFHMIHPIPDFDSQRSGHRPTIA